MQRPLILVNALGVVPEVQLLLGMVGCEPCVEGEEMSHVLRAHSSRPSDTVQK